MEGTCAMTDLCLSWTDVEILVEKLAYQIKRWDEKPDVIYGISRGGLVPAVILSNILDIPMTSDYTVDEDYLIVDDIVDTGVTIEDYMSLDNAKVCSLLVNVRNCGVFPHLYAEQTHELNIFPWDRDIKGL